MMLGGSEEDVRSVREEFWVKAFIKVSRASAGGLKKRKKQVERQP